MEKLVWNPSHWEEERKYLWGLCILLEPKREKRKVEDAVTDIKIEEWVKSKGRVLTGKNGETRIQREYSGGEVGVDPPPYCRGPESGLQNQPQQEEEALGTEGMPHGQVVVFVRAPFL